LKASSASDLYDRILIDRLAARDALFTRMAPAVGLTVRAALSVADLGLFAPPEAAIVAAAERAEDPDRSAIAEEV
jgi:hypothetical protein